MSEVRSKADTHKAKLERLLIISFPINHYFTPKFNGFYSHNVFYSQIYFFSQIKIIIPKNNFFYSQNTREKSLFLLPTIKIRQVPAKSGQVRKNFYLLDLVYVYYHKKIQLKRLRNGRFMANTNICTNLTEGKCKSCNSNKSSKFK